MWGMCRILHPVCLGELVHHRREVCAMRWVSWMETKLSYANKKHVEEDNRKNELWVLNIIEEENVHQDGGYKIFPEVYLIKPLPTSMRETTTFIMRKKFALLMCMLHICESISNIYSTTLTLESSQLH